MDLRDRRRGDRRRVQGREDLGGRPAVLLAQDLLDLVESERADVVAQGRELVDIRLGQQVRPGGEELAQLHERGPEVLQDHPQPARPVLRRYPVAQRGPLDRPHHALQVQCRHHVLITIPHQRRQDLPVSRQVAEMSDRLADQTPSPSRSMGQGPALAPLDRRQNPAGSRPFTDPRPVAHETRSLADLVLQPTEASVKLSLMIEMANSDGFGKPLC